MINLKGKKLLILGGSYSSREVVKIAKSEGVYTIVADYYETGVAKEIADEAVTISTTDYDALLKLIKEKQIDGVFCGPSEFQLVNVMNLCELTGLPFYCTRAQWETCQDKSEFKKMCRKHGVPVIPEYHVTQEFLEKDLEKIKYPVMVKPVDSFSSRGITVCNNSEELKKAYEYALGFSNSKKVIIEKFVKFSKGFAVRYIACDGEVYLNLTNDQYCVDSKNRTALISALGLYPSTMGQYYNKNINPNVVSMFKELGIKNASFFMQALVDEDDGNIYFHEMGLRISGGQLFQITEPVTGVNDLKMMIRYALGESFSYSDELKKIDPFLNKKIAGAFNIPLKPGEIKKITGVTALLEKYNNIKFIQHYYEGDAVTSDKIGTLDQHFCRIKFVVNSIDEIIEIVNYINNTVTITDINGNDMIFMKFDTNRIK